MATSEEYSQLIVDGKIHDYAIENTTTPNSDQQDDKAGKEGDNLLSAVFFITLFYNKSIFFLLMYMSLQI